MEDIKVITLLALHFLHGSSLMLEQAEPPNESPVCSGHKLEYRCVANAISVGWHEGDLGIVLQNSDTNTRVINRFEFQIITSNDSSLLSAARLSKARSLDAGIEIVCSAEGTLLTETVKVAREPESCVGLVTCSFVHSKLNVSLDAPSNLTCVEKFMFEFHTQNKTSDAGQNFAMFDMDNSGGLTFENQNIFTLDNEDRPGLHPCRYNILAPNRVERIFASVEINESNIDLCITVARPTFPVTSCLSPDNVTWSYNISINTTLPSFKVAADKAIFCDVREGDIYEVIVVPTAVELNLSGDPYLTVIVVDKLPTHTLIESVPVDNNIYTTMETGAVVGLSVALGFFFVTTLVCSALVVVLLVRFYRKMKGNSKGKTAIFVLKDAGSEPKKTMAPVEPMEKPMEPMGEPMEPMDEPMEPMDEPMEPMDVEPMDVLVMPETTKC